MIIDWIISKTSKDKSKISNFSIYFRLIGFLFKVSFVF